MKTPSILMAILFVLLASCGDTNVSETKKNENGSNDTNAWWVHITFNSGKPAGYPEFRQTDANGSNVNSVDVTATSGNGKYDGSEKKYNVRIKNRESCSTAPCGYVHAWICAEDNDCTSNVSIKDLGIIHVNAWDLRL